MDQRIVLDKIESLRRCVERIATRSPGTAAALARDTDAQDIVSLNLTRAVQLAVDIAAHVLATTAERPPDTMGETFVRLAEVGVLSASLAGRLRAAVGFRNIAVHNYRSVDWDVVHEIATTRLDDFREFARCVIENAVPKR